MHATSKLQQGRRTLPPPLLSPPPPSPQSAGLASPRPSHHPCLFRCPDLYALLKTTEKLERAFVRDAIAPKDYTPACERLIGQYKTLCDSIRSSVR